MKTNFYNYFIDANQYELISPQREVELAPLIRQGNIQAMHELVTANLKIVGLVARHYRYSNIEFKDALSVGYLTLVEQAKKFDETIGIKFSSYVQPWIHKNIKLAIIQNDTYRIPKNRRSRLNIYDYVLRELEQELEREPTIEEIAIRMDEKIKEEITINKVKETIDDLSAICHVSADTPLNQSTTTTFKDTYVDTPEDEIKEQIREILNSSRITPLEKKMLELRFLEEYTFKELGIIFNYTAVWIGVLVNRAIEKLKKSPIVKNIIFTA